jgi:hypothetical protein
VELAKEEGEQILQTKASKDQKWKPEDDENPTLHGTAVASKADGKQFEVAKAVCFSTPIRGRARCL